MKVFTLNADDKKTVAAIAEMMPDGAAIPEIRRAIRIIDRIESATGDQVVLEDDEHSYLVDKFGKTKFVKADRAVLDLFDRVASAGEYQPGT